jgi:adenylate cyclase
LKSMTDVREIRIKTTPDEQRRLASSRPADPTAAEAYLKGRYSLNKFSGESVAKAVEYFRDATLRDPNHALAYAGLAEAFDVEIALGGITPGDGWPRVKEAATRALELDDTVAEAHAMLGDYYFISEWNWAEADKAYRRAVELNPGYATGQNWYGMFLLAMGRFEEAEERVARAKALDPLSTQNVNLGLVYYHSDRYDRAIKEFQELLALDPGFAIGHLNLGKAYLEKKMMSAAFAEFEKSAALEGAGPDNTNMAYASAVSGKPDKAREILAKLVKRWEAGELPSDRIAMVYAGLGDKDAAFEWLDKAYRERAYDMIMLKVEPRFRTLRSDPRFKALIRKMGL